MKGDSKIFGERVYFPPKAMADAVISQANPVSATLYEVLPTTRNCRILSLSATITWAVTQPTPLEIVVTCDGNTIVFQTANPVSATPYQAALRTSAAETSQVLLGISDLFVTGLLEGRSVRVQVRITWAVTQPTPLVCRIKYAQW